MTSITTPADAQFEAALDEWIHDPNSPKLTTYNCARFGREWERKAALESEPVKALVEALRDLRNICMDGKFYEDHQKAKALIGQATSAIHAFERAKGGEK
jgi:hypothetical protein